MNMSLYKAIEEKLGGKFEERALVLLSKSDQAEVVEEKVQWFLSNGVKYYLDRCLKMVGYVCEPRKTEILETIYAKLKEENVELPKLNKVAAMLGFKPSVAEQSEVFNKKVRVKSVFSLEEALRLANGFSGEEREKKLKSVFFFAEKLLKEKMRKMDFGSVAEVAKLLLAEGLPIKLPIRELEKIIEKIPDSDVNFRSVQEVAVFLPEPNRTNALREIFDRQLHLKELLPCCVLETASFFLEPERTEKIRSVVEAGLERRNYGILREAIEMLPESEKLEKRRIAFDLCVADGCLYVASKYAQLFSEPLRSKALEEVLALQFKKDWTPGEHRKENREMAAEMASLLLPPLEDEDVEES
jgi:hypothetical protein